MRQDDYQQDAKSGRTRVRESADAEDQYYDNTQAKGVNPIARVAGGVAQGARSLVSRNNQSTRAGRTSSREGQQASSSRSASYAGDDYLGTGEPCRLCGRPVEPTQSRCPHCGAFRVPLYQQLPFWIAVVVLVVLIVLFTLAANSCASKPADQGTTPAATDSSDGAATSTEDKTELLAAIAEGQTYIDENAAYGTYTVASVVALRDAMSTAQSVADDASATADQISQATQGISSAVGSLMNCPTGYDGYSWLDHATLLASGQALTHALSAGTGTVLQMTSGTEGTTLTVAMGGDVSTVVSVVYNELSVAEGEPYVGASITFAGVVTGTGSYGDVEIPVLTADYVTVMAE